MLNLNRNGFSNEQVLAALRGEYGVRRITYRYELLDVDHTVIGDLTNVVGAEVSHEALADVKRTARIDLVDDGSVDFLKARIKPYARLSILPEPTPSQGQVERTYDDVVTFSARELLAQWKFDELTGATMAVDRSGNERTLELGSGAFPQAPALVDDGGRSLRLTGTSDSTATASEAGFLNGFTAISFAGWFQADTTGETVDLIRTTVGGTWNEAQDTWDGSDDIWDEPGASDVGGIAVGFDGPTKSITFTVFVNDQEVTVFTPVNTQTTERTFFAATWVSGGKIVLYLNGEKVTEKDSTVLGAINGINSLVVGGEGYAGTIDDFLFTGGALRAQDVQALYETGSKVTTPQNSNTFVEWPLGVFVLSTPPRSADPSGVVTRQVEAYDQTVLLQSQLVSQPYYVAAGETYTNAISELLGDTSGLVSYRVTSSPSVLPALRMWDAGESHLRIVNDLISAIGYEAIWFDENGVGIVAPYVAPSDRPIEYDYSSGEVSVLIPGASQSLDLFDQPNQWVLVVSQPDRPPLVATYTDNDPNSLTSTVNRGRTITDFRTEQDTVDLSVLQDKVERLAQESMQKYEQVEFTTAVMPIHTHRDVYQLSYPALGVNAAYNETKWSFPLEAGAVMSHTARRVLPLGQTPEEQLDSIPQNLSAVLLPAEQDVDRDNLAVNPAMASATFVSSEWRADNGTVSRVTGSGLERDTFARATVSSAPTRTNLIASSIAVTAGQTYTASAWVRSSVSEVGRFQITWFTSGPSYIDETRAATFTHVAGQFTRVSVTGVAPAGAAIAEVALVDETTGAGQTLDMTMVLFEETATLGSYFDGSSVGGSWSGTVGRSPSNLLVAGGRSIQLNWDDVADADSYAVFASNFPLGYGTSEVSEFVVGPLPQDGATRDYWVSSVIDDVVSARSNTVTVTVPVGESEAPPAPVNIVPQNFTATGNQTTGTIQLQWDDVAGASSYRIYETLSPQGVDPVSVSESLRGPFPLDGRTYNYWVTATVAGVESTPSNTATVKLGTESVPDPANLLASVLFNDSGFAGLRTGDSGIRQWNNSGPNRFERVDFIGRSWGRAQISGGPHGADIRAEGIVAAAGTNNDFKMSEGQEFWFADTIVIGSGFPAVHFNNVLQWKNDGTGSAPLYFGAWDGNMQLRSSFGNRAVGAIDFGNSHRYMFRIRFGSNNSGWIEAYRDGIQTLARTTASTLVAGRQSYPKIGYYRGDEIVGTGNVYHRDYRIGTTRASVE